MLEDVTYRTVTGDAGWSAEIPNNWQKQQSDSVEVYGVSDSTFSSVGVSVQNVDMTYSQMSASYGQWLKENAEQNGFADFQASTGKLGRETCRKYTMIQDPDGAAIHYEVYVTIHNGKMYTVSIAVSDVYASEYHLDILYHVVNSFTFASK